MKYNINLSSQKFDVKCLNGVWQVIIIVLNPGILMGMNWYNFIKWIFFSELFHVF